MNNMDLLKAISGVSDEPVLRAREPLHHSRRILLIAAAVAAALLLVGCVAAFLRLEDFSMGQFTYTQEYDNQGNTIEPTEKTVDSLSQGKRGEAISEAQKEWFAFLDTYDPNGEFSTNDDAIDEIPDNYEYNYGCYTREMMDQLDAIVQKHNLKLLDTRIGFQSDQANVILEATGIDSLLRENSCVKIKQMAGMFYPPCNLRILCTLDSGDGRYDSTVRYDNLEYFPHDNIAAMDLDTTQQWAYTSADGTPLLLGLSQDGKAVIIADFPDAVMSIAIDGSADETTETMSKEKLEKIADSFDYRIKPQNVDRAAVEQRMQEAEAK